MTVVLRISELNNVLRKITVVYFFSIIANEEKKEGGKITSKVENMYTNLFHFPSMIHNSKFKYRYSSIQFRLQI